MARATICDVDLYKRLDLWPVWFAVNVIAECCADITAEGDCQSLEARQRYYTKQVDEVVQSAIEAGTLKAHEKDVPANVKAKWRVQAFDRKRLPIIGEPKQFMTRLYVERVQFLKWAVEHGYPVPEYLLIAPVNESIPAPPPQAATDETTHTPPAESIVLHVSQDAKGMTLTANGKKIRFCASKGKSTKEMQIVHLLINRWPKGASAAELITAAWPDHTKNTANPKRLVSMAGNLRSKARDAGLPEDIFPKIMLGTLKDAKRRYAISCGKIEGADVFRTKDDRRTHALPVMNEASRTASQTSAT